MAPGSYLGQLASRAVNRVQTIAPPRRPTRLAAAAFPEEVYQLAVAPRAPITRQAPRSERAIEIEAPLAQIHTAPVQRIADSPLSTPSPPPSPSRPIPPARPAPDFAFAAPRRLAPPIAESAQQSAPAVRPTTSLADQDSNQRSVGDAIPPAHPVAALPRPTAPDPLALALARAVRWTSSDPDPIEPPASAREVEHARPPQLEPTPHAHRERPARASGPSEASPHEPIAPLIVHAPPIQVLSPQPTREHARPPAPSKPAEPRATVHIGSVEVEIVTAAPATPTVSAAPAASSTRSVSQLSRPLTSSIGLRQS